MKAVSDRSLGLRHQVGLQAVHVIRSRTSGVVVHEPISGKTYELRDDEYFVLTQLQPDVSLAELKRRFELRFVDRRVTVSQLQSLLFRLHGLGLTVNDTFDQASALLRRGAREKRKQWAGGLAHWMFLRLPGVDPAPLMRLAMPICKPFLGWRGLLALSSLVLAAATILLVHQERFWAELPSLDRYLKWENALTLALVVAATKVIHELGHAIVSEHFGAPCRSIGVMLMVFTPALYCDVSASWMIANRWKRIAIALAGMGAELICASLAILVWYRTPSGLVHGVAAHVVLVCGISTILVNSNPLLRYDGYYVLSDLLGVPNLSQRASERWNRFFRRRVLGIETPDRPADPVDESWWLLAYAIASASYRWILMATVTWFVWTMLRPVGLEIIGQTMAFLVIVGLAITLLQPVLRWWRDPGKRGRLTMKRRIGLFICACLLALALLVPFPSHVVTTGRILPHTESRVFVQTSGELAELFVQPGQTVHEGDVIARLFNADLHVAIVEAKGKLAIQEERVASLERTKHTVPESFEQITSVMALLQQRQDELASAIELNDGLTLRAPCDGLVLAPAGWGSNANRASNDRDWMDPDADRDPTASIDSITLTRSNGLPTDHSNQGCWLVAGTELLSVAKLDRWIVEASIDALQAERLAVGSGVSVLIESSKNKVHRGTVTGLSRQRSAPMSDDGSRRDTPESQRQSETPTARYLVVVEIAFEDQSAQEQPLFVGGKARLKIEATKISLAVRTVQQLAGLFRFR